MVQSTATKSSKTLLPGFGRPLRYTPSKGDPDYIEDPFPSALSTTYFNGSCMLPLTTVREFVMLQFMNSITDKQDWHIKVNNPEITAKWKEEALAYNHEDLTEKMVDYCLDELRYKSSLIPAPPAKLPPVFVYNGDVMKSDNALSLQFKEELQQAVKIFEAQIAERLKDWHPGSDGKVWNLVHPSLFPLVYGRTRILENGERTTLEDCIDRCGQGAITKVPREDEASSHKQRSCSIIMNPPFSRKFQWLPCEVDISGNEAKITSYINNLHPQKEQPLYRLMEKLIDACLPLWDLTLAPIVFQDYGRPRIRYFGVDYEKVVEEGQSPVEEDYDAWSDVDWDTRTVIRPEPKGEFDPSPSLPKFSLREKYGKRGLQLIVKLANIELTPEKPQYDGGSWHIEGQMNEHIVATALYYYSSTNITSSTLSFRQWFSVGDTSELYYKPHYDAWLMPIYGCEADGPAVQDIGSIDTREGRLLTFPNILQHRVGPFKLADPTKTGHRKIVALFLVDPNTKITSTAHVPCQQQEWWWDRVATQTPQGVSLPRELQDHILEDVDFPFSLREAKMLREELIEERKDFSFAHSENLNSRVHISLCEH